MGEFYYRETQNWEFFEFPLEFRIDKTLPVTVLDFISQLLQLNSSFGMQYFDLIISLYFCCSLGMKVPTIVKEAQHALDNGQCIVIGLQTTGEVGVAL